ncbi:unnamed protein product [Trichogramma brassicae]|uniref:Uncharacterized protein n=1 Tax=Trichogramma brassicae TaxID=86971 RepID=A0A6H5HWW2_9HYME|nr:unnamed protein product [Trichogramma brassicae]
MKSYKMRKVDPDPRLLREMPIHRTIWDLLVSMSTTSTLSCTNLPRTRLTSHSPTPAISALFLFAFHDCVQSFHSEMALIAPSQMPPEATGPSPRTSRDWPNFLRSLRIPPFALLTRISSDTSLPAFPVSVLPHSLCSPTVCPNFPRRSSLNLTVRSAHQSLFSRIGSIVLGSLIDRIRLFRRIAPPDEFNSLFDTLLLSDVSALSVSLHCLRLFGKFPGEDASGVAEPPIWLPLITSSLWPNTSAGISSLFASHSALSENVTVEKLKSLREKVSWEIEEERREFLKEFISLVENWKGPYPDLRKIFRPEEIDWILSEEVKNMTRVGLALGRVRFILPPFLINCDYRDQPVLDKEGKLSLRRTTPLHDPMLWNTEVHMLFSIYDRFDANYIDDVGYTHFHAACAHSYTDYVERFLESGQDPNLLLESTGESPLHMAVKRHNFGVAMLLLKKGANVNLANKDGETVLHLMANVDFYGDLNEGYTFFKELFKINEQHQITQIEAKDKWGRTPLEWAVTGLSPYMVGALFNFGADVSNFVFPPERQLDKRCIILGNDDVDGYKLRIASGALTVLECLKRRGYELERRDALKIMKIFLEFAVFRRYEDHEKEFVVEDLRSSGDFIKCWYNDEEFTSESRKIMINPSLSLYELLRLWPGEAEKRLTYENFFEFTQSSMVPLKMWENDSCAAYLNEMMARRFCRRWALEPFMEITRYQLPILCCEKILENLKNEDLCRVCFAATDHDIHWVDSVLSDPTE